MAGGAHVAPDVGYSKSQASFRFRKPKNSFHSRNEDFGISFYSLFFTNRAMEEKYRASRNLKYRSRLKFGSGFTAFFIPLLVAMQVGFKNNSSNPWANLPLVVIFPGIVFILGFSVWMRSEEFQKRRKTLALFCLIGQISALLDTTTAAQSVNESNVWVQLIFSLGISSSTGILYLESLFVLIPSSLFFIILAWTRYFLGDRSVKPGCEDMAMSLSTPGTTTVAVVLYTILLAFLAWNWEFEERRDFCVTERLAQENVMVHMTMQMTGWFSGGAAGASSVSEGAGGILGTSCHIDPADVHLGNEIGSGAYGSVYVATWKETKVAVKKLFVFDSNAEHILKVYMWT